MAYEVPLDIFNIDLHNLDKEWSRQPGLYFKWASILADARRDVEQANAKLDLTKAELDSDIRSNPERFDLPKLTEPAIKNCILAHGRHIAAAEHAAKLKHDVDVLSAAVVALDHRKKALEGEVTLFCHSYNAEPKAPLEAREMWQKKSEESTVKQIKDKLNKKPTTIN